MSDELLFNEYNLVSIYQQRAFRMMNIYRSEEVEKFCEWVNKFEYVANIIEVPDEKMIKFFKKMVDNDVQNRIKKILFAVNFHVLSYDELIDNYLYYFYLCEQTGYQYRFVIRNQYEKEPIRNYAQELIKIYNKCDYEEITQNILCEKFFHGLREDLIRIELFNHTFSSFDELVATAIEFEEFYLITYYRDRALLIINSYNQEQEGHFHVWLNKFEYVADKIEVPDYKIRELFYTMVDTDVFASVEANNISTNFHRLSYDDATKIFFRHYFPITEIDLNKKRFLCRNQYEQETIKEYGDNLKKIYDKCDNTNFQEERLCEKFKNGLCDKNLKACLKEISGATFHETIATAIKLKRKNLVTIFQNEILLRINVYHPESDGSFYLWLNKFEFAASIIGIPDNMIIEIFNKMVHVDVHTYVRTTNSHVIFSKLSYDELVNNYLSIFTSPYEIYLHRDRFMCRIQYENETIENYSKNLKRIIDKCEYGENMLEILYKKFIDGLRENDIRIHLKNNTYLTYDQLVAEAVKFEKVNLITYYLNRIIVMINRYNQEKEGLFYVWLNRFEYLAAKIEVPDNKMIELFCNMVHIDVHKLLQKIYLSGYFSKFSYENIIDYYLPLFASSHEFDVDIQRFKSRKQFRGESIEEYAVSLRKLRDKYYYKTGYKEDLRIQFVSGIRDEYTSAQLNVMPNLSFEQMVVWAIEFRIKRIIPQYS